MAVDWPHFEKVMERHYKKCPSVESAEQQNKGAPLFLGEEDKSVWKQLEWVNAEVKCT